MNRQKLKGNAMLLLTAMIWGMSFIAQSKGVEDISPVAFTGLRSILGSIVLLPVIAVLDWGKKKHNKPVQKINRDLIIGGILCGIVLCLASTLQTMGMVYTSPGKSAFITALYMVIIPIVGLFCGKKLRPVIALSVVIATVGLYMICVNSSSGINKGDIITLACSFLFTAHILVIDHFSPKVDGVKLSCIQFFVCGLINLTYMFIFEEPQLSPIIGCWASIGFSGIMSCGVAYTLQIVGQKYTDPTSASILMSLESVFAALSSAVLVALGWSITGGNMDLREIIGCVLMFGAIILVQLPERG